MKKGKKWMWIACICAAAVIIAGIAVVINMNKEKGNVNRVMYVPYGENSYVMIDQENGMIFTVTFPEEIYDLDGKQITQAELKKGNILEITGNGVMAESYPGQYPGVTKIRVVEEGQESDAERYQDIIDSIYSEPDPSAVPWLSVEYRTELAQVSTAIPNGGYKWTYEDENGQMQSVVADSAHVLMWNEELYGDVSPGEATDLTLIFSKEPVKVEVSRWAADHGGDQAYLDTHQDGESVAVEQKEGHYFIPKAEQDDIYRVTATWENGTVEYGFKTR